MNCPSCSRNFSDSKSMKIHHKLKHGESLALEESICINCDKRFTYYPSNKEGKVCSNCGKNSSSWGETMEILRESDKWGEINSKGRDGPMYQKRRIRQIKQSSSCNRCGYDDDPRALQFHHINEKNNSIPEIVNSSYSWGELLEELRLCEIVCANCHVIHHTSDW